MKIGIQAQMVILYSAVEARDTGRYKYFLHSEYGMNKYKVHMSIRSQKGLG
jgi:hypothetical protein